MTTDRQDAMQLRAAIAQQISFAIQGVQEFTHKDIAAYYANRDKWVDLETDQILALFQKEQLQLVTELLSHKQRAYVEDGVEEVIDFIPAKVLEHKKQELERLQ